MLSTTYLKYQEKYVKQFGENTIVLMQIGSFYEFYSFDPSLCEDVNEKSEQKNNEWQNNDSWPTEKIGLVEEIAPLLNMAITRKDKKKPYSLNNCAMAGFPVVSYEKHRDVLSNHNYKIVRMDQKKTIKNGKEEIERFVADVYSAGTSLDANNIPVTNNIVTIYIEILKTTFNVEDYVLAIGWSCIDVTTGENTVAEFYSENNNSIVALQEIYRCIISAQPREIVIFIKYDNKFTNELTEKYEKFVWDTLKLDKFKTVNIHNANTIEVEYYKLPYQKSFLCKVFNHNLNSNILEDLALERLDYGRLTYILCLQYCYEHNGKCIEKIKIPDTSYIDSKNFLTLTHNAIEQLNILSSKTISLSSTNNYKHNRNANKIIDSLFSVVNYTKTNLGKRHLMKMLTHPITNVNILQSSYNSIDFLIKNNTQLTTLTTLLKEIPDIERYQRKLYLQVIKPHELTVLFESYEKIINIYTYIYENSTSLHYLLFDSSEFAQCYGKVVDVFKLDVLKSHKIDGQELTSFCNNEKSKDTDDKSKEDNETPENEDVVTDIYRVLYENVDSEYDVLYKKYNEQVKKLYSILETLNKGLEKTKGKLLTFENKKNRNIGFWTTPHKADVLKKKFANLTYTNHNKEVLITSTDISDTCQNVTVLAEQLQKRAYIIYIQTLNSLSQYKFYKDVAEFISKTDFLCSSSLAAIKNNYSCPTIIQSQTSFIEIVDMRHPIVEVLIPDKYVENTILLGKESDPNNCKDINKDMTKEKENKDNEANLQGYAKGLILYGQNSSGKSTFGKAVALNCILAQAGMFTAGKVTFSPYHRICTRLSGHDDVLNGLSSFVVEMKELRTILRGADCNSLIVADEIARGTESESALALTASAVNSLINSKSTFIFSTHLHSLTDLQLIKDLKNELQISHLALKYCQEEKKLIYDRRLRPGPGDSIYGLEVAHSLGLDSQFMKMAYNIRKEIVHENTLFLNFKKSNYNYTVYMDKCYVCGSVENLETHHIEEQYLADNSGFINTMHKNIPTNLCILCKKCHDGFTFAKEKIQMKKVFTSKGLDVTY